MRRTPAPHKRSRRRHVGALIVKAHFEANRWRLLEFSRQHRILADFMTWRQVSLAVVSDDTCRALAMHG